MGRSTAAQLFGNSVRQAAVLVPKLAAGAIRCFGVIDLHAAHAALHQPPGHQALLAERFRHRLVEAVELLRSACDSRVDVERLRRFALHPERQFERGDAGVQIGVLLALVADAIR